MRIPIDREERKYIYFPFVGAVDTPSIKLGSGDWVELELDAMFDADPEVEDADWYRGLFAGPECTGNPAGTIVVTGLRKVKFKVAAPDGGEIDVQPDGEPIWIEVT